METGRKRLFMMIQVCFMCPCIDMMMVRSFLGRGAPAMYVFSCCGAVPLLKLLAPL
jgi:hypothetical protein